MRIGRSSGSISSGRVKLTRLNGCIYVDNVVRELLEHENVGENESLVTKVGREESVTATLVSTVCSSVSKK